MAKYEIMVLACQVGPLHLTLTQIYSKMNRIAKNKCPENQKLGTRRRGVCKTTDSRKRKCIVAGVLICRGLPSRFSHSFLSFTFYLYKIRRSNALPYQWRLNQGYAFTFRLKIFDVWWEQLNLFKKMEVKDESPITFPLPFLWMVRKECALN